jgi:hypothetical protein
VFTILAIVLGFVLVTAAMRAMDWAGARRLTTARPAAPATHYLD